ncbi:MAG: ATP-binding cassette domain-containing protein [Anaerolineae bacterium]|jgi:energy-coupling factor transport system ATP-binding protein
MPNGESLIQVSDLHYAYEDGTIALRGIDLEVGAEEFIAFIGQNGSGKTTLSKCLNGLFKPTSGSVIVRNLDTSTRGIVKQLVTEVGYVFQNPDHQLFNSSAWDEIAYGPRNIGLSKEEVEERVREAAAVAGVHEDLFSEHPFFMHKGLRQRVAIASILALRPRTIIVDEPTTGQDRKQSLEIMDFLKGLRDEEGHTIIIITHEMPIVAEYAERVVALCEGRVLLDGSTKEVFSQPDVLAETFVHPPQIARLGQLLSDVPMPPDVLTVAEMREIVRSRLNG